MGQVAIFKENGRLKYRTVPLETGRMVTLPNSLSPVWLIKPKLELTKTVTIIVTCVR